MLFRQGDVTFERVDVAGDGKHRERENGRLIVAHGESGHLHAVSSPDVQMIAQDHDIDTGIIGWLIAPDKFVIDHEEHNSLTIPEGVWIVRIERDYTPQEIRRVVD